MGLIDREKRIENLICRFPALIGVPPVHQMFRQHQYNDGSQVDVVYRWSTTSLVVEIKKTPLSATHLKQLRRYIFAETKETGWSDVRGLLLGQVSTKSEVLVRMIGDWGLNAEIKYVGSDIRLQVKLCRNCTNPFWADYIKCPHCLSAENVVIDFANK